MNYLYSKGDYIRQVERDHKDAEDHRSDFRKDFGRLIHSSVFRRLQGKTQLFPGIESDYFRNRLTHSMEVAQICNGIALHLNNTNGFLKENPLDTDLVEFAGLAHDLGHPPFGHIGEEALHERMLGCGGYEGNAQTLRILSTLEKRQFIQSFDSFSYEGGVDSRAGINSTFRSLASILKYDEIIPEAISNADPQKGYFHTEQNLVHQIKQTLIGDATKPFKSVECWLMDVADDISYSVYDLDDTIKANFLSFVDIFSAQPMILVKVAEKVTKNIKKLSSYYEDEYGKPADIHYDPIDVYKILSRVLAFDSLVALAKQNENGIGEIPTLVLMLKEYGTNGYLRSKLTSRLIHRFICGVEFKLDDHLPILSKVYLKKELREEVEVLKNFVYISQIESSRLKIAAKRGKEIVSDIFDILVADDGYKLMPNDFIEVYEKIPVQYESYKRRTICDFIAGMTDRYAIEFYGRLKSENPQTIFKPF